jgi:hypothetical protein
MHMRRALLRITHNKVLAAMFVLAAIMEATVLVILGVRGEDVSALNAAWAAFIGGGVVWSYLVLTGRLKAE